MLRYLAAFGPATVADATTWSRLTGLREVFERLRPQLRTFRDERGRELFDLPDAPRPNPNVPAAPRFLPEYDNVLLSYADRSRFVPDRAGPAAVRGRVRGTVLVDGLVSGVWRIGKDPPILVVEQLAPLSKRTRAAVAAEGRRYLRFAIDADDQEVRFE